MGPTPDVTDLYLELLLAMGADDDALAAAAAEIATEGISVEEIVLDTLRRVNETRPCEVHIARWYRRAVGLGQGWAMEHGGLMWSSTGIPEWDPRPSEPADTCSVSPREALGWLVKAADLGRPRACVHAAARLRSDPRALSWLRTAHEFGTALNPTELGAASLLLARILAETDDPEALVWFRSAAEQPQWGHLDQPFDLDDSQDHDLSWTQAVTRLARWAHDHDNDALCVAWSFRILESYALEGPQIRWDLDNTTSTEDDLADDPLLRHALANEVAHVRTMRHLLTEHEISPRSQLEVALLLGGSRQFCREDAAMVRSALLPSGDLDLTVEQLDGGPRPRNRAPRVVVHREHAWAALHWLLADVIPATLRHIGLGDSADRFAAQVPEHLRDDEQRSQVSEAVAEVDLNGITPHQSLHGARAWSLDALYEHVLPTVRKALDWSGLGERRNQFCLDGTAHEDTAAVTLDGMSWRMMRGAPLWLAMRAATADDDDPDAWSRGWDEASGLLAYVLQLHFAEVHEQHRTTHRDVRHAVDAVHLEEVIDMLQQKLVEYLGMASRL